MRTNASNTVVSNRPVSSGRRRFLGRACGAAIATVVASKTDPPILKPFATAVAEAGGSPTRHSRIEQAYEMREQAARYQEGLPGPQNFTNCDEELYPNRIANYTKGLPHDELGRVVSATYAELVGALENGDSARLEKLQLGGGLKLVNPQAGLCFGLEGADYHHFELAAPPNFGSAEQAGEMTELYWQALTRDVPFSRYESDPLTALAAGDLTRLADFRGPKNEARVTPQTLFRGNTKGDLSGPYISQFLWQDVPYGANRIVQRIRTVAPAVNFMTSFDHWLAIQNGNHPMNAARVDDVHRYIRNSRDLARYVQLDFSYGAFLNACLILLGSNASFDPANPYRTSPAQTGFSTFGAPHVLDMLAKVANHALKACWYQKWYVHRRVRPEEFSGAVHNHCKRAANHPIHTDVLDSPALETIMKSSGTYLLPQAYAEGCPAHPSYPAGHAVVAGACATVLKMFFDEAFVMRKSVEASADGLSLVPYKGLELTVGDELNKLAANISIGRNAAGVHWRSDAMQGLKLGEAVAISLMKEERVCLNENYGNFALTKFDGRTVAI